MVKWKHYANSNKYWEPASNLTEAAEAIDDFNRARAGNNKKKKRKKKASGSDSDDFPSFSDSSEISD